MPKIVYTRVKEKRTGHRYDVLLSAFDPKEHELVKKGPVSGESSYARRVQLNVKRGRTPDASTETSGEPSGETNKETENKE